jgi:hypothetical protein
MVNYLKSLLRAYWKLVTSPMSEEDKEEVQLY